jgi:transposase-like protein
VARESVRRWVAQAEIGDGARPGTTSEESAEVKRLKAENRRLSAYDLTCRSAYDLTCRSSGELSSSPPGW